MPVIGLLALIIPAQTPAVSSMVEDAWADEYYRLSHDLDPDNKVMRWYGESKVKDYVWNQQAMITESDNSPLDIILRRTEALLNDIAQLEGAPDLSGERNQLDQLASQAQNASDEEAMFKQIAALRRSIAFKNPLINFDQVVFFKNSMDGTPHMVQVYNKMRGCDKNNPGLYILKDAFGEGAHAENLLENATIENGPNAGKSLNGEAAITPDLSFEGDKIVFSSSPADLDDYFYLFSINPDGSELRQVTFPDESERPEWVQKERGIDAQLWDMDVDPCFLPGGRIAFISQRRGGHGRCHGGGKPTFTLFSVRPDGQDLIPLSYHETNEWTPSVNNDGMIVYSRWDYIDRDSDIAHHFWICGPDGTDPRSPHGNYPHPLYPTDIFSYDNPYGRKGRSVRPWFEWSIRAIPDRAGEYVAIAGAHHGAWLGSIIHINTKVPDDGAQSQLRRITPEIEYPESERGGSLPAASTPWPLNENYYITSYSDIAGHGNKSKRATPPHTLGIYLVDAFGNHELLYRDPDINSFEPIPLVAREKPNAIPTRTSRGIDGNKTLGQATISVTDIYNSDFDWPENTVIKYMRIVQIFPKSTGAANKPQIGYGNQSTARASLGIVPVESDGSVYCEAPVGKVLLFQALDSNKLAIAGMRSATYVHEGENLSCTGCHEDKWDVTPTPDAPIAQQRPPSPLETEPNMNKPILFPTLVQPVLDNKCAPCHAQKEKAPSLSNELLHVATGAETKGSQKGYWTVAYKNLEPYAFYLHGGGNGEINDKLHGGSRWLAGKMGAISSKLLNHLYPSHNDVQLTEEERYRITLWMDLNSEYFGAYYDCEKQAQGEFVAPRYDYTEEPVAAGPENKPSHRVVGSDLKRFAIISSPEGIRAVGLPDEARVRFFTIDGRMVGEAQGRELNGRALGNVLPARGMYLITVNDGVNGRLLRKQPLIW